MPARQMTEQEARGLYQQGEDTVVAWMLAMDQRVRALEARQAQNSRNSSKPPSTDPDDKKLKPMSLRGKSGKKPGGQKGHPGATLKQVDNPDHIQEHRPDACPHCRAELQEAETLTYMARQVFEMPEPKVQVTEHRALKVVCPCCQAKVQAHFPSGVNQPVQYGPRILGFGVYLHADHLIPLFRSALIVQRLTGALFNSSTLHTAMKVAYQGLEVFEEQAQQALSQEAILHVDETSSRVAGTRYWFHVRCTSHLTYLFCHAKRGGEAVKDLLAYRGRLVSDFFSNYVTLDCKHQFCMAHICRELVGVFEQTGQVWAKELKEHLEKCLAACHRARQRGSPKLWSARKLSLEFERLVGLGSLAHPAPVADSGKKKPRRSKARALVDRLRDYRDECLAFLFDLSVPFTNNQAERDVRMLKVKGKVSGCFRRLEGAVRFCRVRSYLQTCGKQGLDRLDCLRSIFAGEPIMPSFKTA
jgi:transposase